jgi:hypothetical protein
MTTTIIDIDEGGTVRVGQDVVGLLHKPADMEGETLWMATPCIGVPTTLASSSMGGVLTKLLRRAIAAVEGDAA